MKTFRVHDAEFQWDERLEVGMYFGLSLDGEMPQDYRVSDPTSIAAAANSLAIEDVIKAARSMHRVAKEQVERKYTGFDTPERFASGLRNSMAFYRAMAEALGGTVE